MDFKIIHVVLGKANPERMNGVNKVVNSLAHHQKNLGYQVAVWGLTKDPRVNFPSRDYDTELFLDRSKFQLDPRIQKELISCSPDTVFHIHGGFIPQFYSLARLLVRHGYQYTYTPHGAFNTVALERSVIKKQVYIQLFERYLVKHAKQLHFIGQSEVHGAESIFGVLNYSLIPNGQEIEPDATPIHSNTGNNSPIFGFVGRLDIHTKGLDILLHGFAEYVVNTDHSAQLWLIGDGPERHTLEGMARELHIEHQVRFLGSRYGEEKMSLIKQMDMFCLCSRNEGLPGVVLEAASVGIPAIVSQETNMGEYIRTSEAGICLALNDSRSIAEAMATSKVWKSTGKLISIGQNASKMVRSEFDWTHIAMRMVESYAA